MPIYAYRCAACGHAKDVLQKMSDPVLSTCPVCGADAFQKQLTAAGFQLKGSGWYVTDFKGGASAAKPADAPAGAATKAAEAGEGKTAEAKPAAAPAASTSSDSGGSSSDGSSGGGAVSAAGCGGGCACH